MPQFSYKARRRSGEVVEGMLDVADRSAALIQIERLGLFPVAVDVSKSGAAAVTAEKPAGQKADWKALLPPSLRAAMSQKRKPKLQELSTFTQQMANLLNSGMPLTVALILFMNSFEETRGLAAIMESSPAEKGEPQNGRTTTSARSV